MAFHIFLIKRRDKHFTVYACENYGYYQLIRKMHMQTLFRMGSWSWCHYNLQYLLHFYTHTVNQGRYSLWPTFIVAIAIMKVVGYSFFALESIFAYTRNRNDCLIFSTLSNCIQRTDFKILMSLEKGNFHSAV